MATFELETIEPPEGAKGVWSMASRDVKALQDEAYARGYKAGVETANAGLDAEQNRLLSAINEALEDQRFDFEQANARVHAGVGDLVQAIAQVLAPRLAQTHFDDLVLGRLSDVLREGLEGRLEVRLSPEATARLAPLVEEKRLRADLISDAQCAPLQARLDWAAGYDRLDAEAAVQMIETFVSDYVEITKELSDERHRSAG